MKRNGYLIGSINWLAAAPLLLSFGATLALVFAASGCHTPEPVAPAVAAAEPPEGHTVRLNAGDVVQVTFPASPNLNTTERVRLDGKLVLPLVAEVPAAGKTPKE